MTGNGLIASKQKTMPNRPNPLMVHFNQHITVTNIDKKIKRVHYNQDQLDNEKDQKEGRNKHSILKRSQSVGLPWQSGVGKIDFGGDRIRNKIKKIKMEQVEQMNIDNKLKFLRQKFMRLMGGGEKLVFTTVYGQRLK